MSNDTEIGNMQLLLATYATSEAAQTAYKTLQKEKKEQTLELIDIALVYHDDGNKIHIHEVEDVDSKHGAAFGGLIGLLLGLLSGPLGVVVALPTGAILGGLAAYAIDMGIPNHHLKQIGEALKPGTAAVVAILSENQTTAVAKHLEASGATVFGTRLKETVPEELAQIATQIEPSPPEE